MRIYLRGSLDQENPRHGRSLMTETGAAYERLCCEMEGDTSAGGRYKVLHKIDMKIVIFGNYDGGCENFHLKVVEGMEICVVDNMGYSNENHGHHHHQSHTVELGNRSPCLELRYSQREEELLFCSRKCIVNIIYDVSKK
jgi:hypothetical protein